MVEGVLPLPRLVVGSSSSSEEKVGSCTRLREFFYNEEKVGACTWLREFFYNNYWSSSTF